MKEDYTLLTNKYFNNHQELRYICPNGHHHYISWGNWQQGRRCPCFSNRPPITLEFIKKEFEKENYVLLSTEYKNAHQKLNFICDGRHGKKHRGEMSWSNWNHPKKYRCGECFKISQIGSGHWNWQGGLSFQEYCEAWKDKEYKKFIKERDGFKCMNPFCNSRGEVILSIHHIDYDKKNCSPNNLITLCRACNSKANIDREWHKSFYNTIVFRRNYNNKSR